MGIYYKYKDETDEYWDLRDVASDASIRGPRLESFSNWLARRQAHPIQMDISFSKGLACDSVIRVVLRDMENGGRSSVFICEELNGMEVVLDDLFSDTRKMPAIKDANLEQHCALLIQVSLYWSYDRMKGAGEDDALPIEEKAMIVTGTDEVPASSLHELLGLVDDDCIAGLPEIFFDAFRKRLGFLDFRRLPPSSLDGGLNVGVDVLKELGNSIAANVIKGVDTIAHNGVVVEGLNKTNEKYILRLREKLKRELILNGSSVVLNGKSYRLTEQQREVVKYFIDQYQRGAEELRTKEVLRAFAPPESRLKDSWFEQTIQKAFFNDHAEIYRRLFKSAAKGFVSLNLSEEK